MKSEEKQLAPPETVSRNARNHLSDEQWRSLLEKTLKQANLFNDAYMNLFFEDAIPCVQLMVDKIIGDGYTVEHVQIQKTIPQFGLKSVRLDVTAHDDEGGRHIFEFQVILDKFIPRRGRYYLSSSDVQMLRMGQNYSELQDVTIVFICLGDVLGYGKPVQTFTMKDENGVELNDGHKMILINAAYDGQWELSDLMHDLCCSEPEEMVYDEFRERSRNVKQLNRKEDKMLQFGAEMESFIESIVKEREAEINAEADAKIAEADARVKAEQEKARAEREKVKAERHTQILRQFKKGRSADIISDFLDYPLPEIERMQAEFRKTGTFTL